MEQEQGVFGRRRFGVWCRGEGVRRGCELGSLRRILEARGILVKNRIEKLLKQD